MHAGSAVAVAGNSGIDKGQTVAVTAELPVNLIRDFDDLGRRNESGALAPQLVGDLEPEPSILKCAYSSHPQPLWTRANKTRNEDLFLEPLKCQMIRVRELSPSVEWEVITPLEGSACCDHTWRPSASR
jgi:hypothetical protein